MRPFALLVALLLLGGCFFSSRVQDAVERRGTAIEMMTDSVLVTGISHPRLLRCPRAESWVYRVEIGPDTFWLHLVRSRDGEAILCDAAPTDSARAVPVGDPTGRGSCALEASGRPGPPGPDTLDLVISAHRIPFQVVDSAGVPRRALLVLAPESPRRGDSAWIVSGRTTLLAPGEPQPFQSTVQVRTPALGHARRRAARLRASPWYLLTVPLDVVTSPLQIAAGMVFLAGASLAVLGLGGHPW